MIHCVRLKPCLGWYLGMAAKPSLPFEGLHQAITHIISIFYLWVISSIMMALASSMMLWLKALIYTPPLLALNLMVPLAQLSLANLAPPTLMIVRPLLI